jgi:hypothetical protein
MAKEYGLALNVIKHSYLAKVQSFTRELILGSDHTHAVYVRNVSLIAVH